jgi:hypothetical protein
MQRSGEKISRWPDLDKAAGVHDRHPICESGHDTEIVGNQNDPQTIITQGSQQCHDSRLDRHVQRSGRLIGDQQLRSRHQRHGDRNALTHPAGKFVGILAQSLLRLIDPDEAQQLQSPLPCARRRQRAAIDHGLGHLLSDFQVGRERIHRILRYECNAGAADGVESRLTLREDFTALIPYGTVRLAITREQTEASEKRL